MNHISAYKKCISKDFIHPCQCFNLHEVFDHFTSKFASVAKFRGVLLDVSVSDQMPQYFSGNPLQINSLLKNLFTYAINQLKGGCIFFKIKSSQVDHDEYRIDINITTSSGGIPYSQLSTIFQPVTETGEQGHNSLYIAKTLAVSMKGDLTIENTSGWGTKYCTHVIMKSDETSWDAHGAFSKEDYSNEGRETNTNHFLMRR